MKKIIAFMLVLSSVFCASTAFAALPTVSDFGEFRVVIPENLILVSTQDNNYTYVAANGTFMMLTYRPGAWPAEIFELTDDEVFAYIDEVFSPNYGETYYRIAAEKSGGCYKVATLVSQPKSAVGIVAIAPTGTIICFVDSSAQNGMNLARYMVQSIFAK